ncbi:MAG TPA: sugar ABC transporter permease [Spirillospora sp.]|nr:sugar ABC transporter permease [Spirillospora sp.]
MSTRSQPATTGYVRRSGLRINRDRVTAFLMLLPSLILLAIFVYGFIGETIYTSMTDWGEQAGLALDPEINFVGFANYEQLFSGLLDVRFRQDLVNTFFFTLFFLSACLILGLLLAILLDQNIKGEGIFRTIFLFPMALSFIVTGTIWRWLFNPRGGINVLPTVFGLDAWDIRWLTDRTQVLRFNWQDLPVIAAAAVLIVLALLALRFGLRNQRRPALVTALAAGLILVWLLAGGARTIPVLAFPETHGFNLAFIGIIIAATWQLSGYTMAMYLAGLRGIPIELREAARVDGASEIQVYRYIVLPILQPITLSAVIVLGHISLKIFDLIFAMAGADNATTDVPGILMYLTAFRGNQFAKGAAIAVVMLAMVAVVIIPYLVSTLRQEHEV